MDEGEKNTVQAEAKVVDDWTAGIDEERERLRKEDELARKRSSALARYQAQQRRGRRSNAKLSDYESHFRQIENELFVEAASVIRGGLRAMELETEEEAQGSPQLPEEWIEEFGAKEAKKMFRAARYALNNSKNAPVALKLASDTFAGISKARATEKSGPRTLNMVVAEMPSVDLPAYDSIVVDE